MSENNRALNFIFKAFVVSVMAVALIIGSIVLYMRLYGDAVIEKSLSVMLGSQVKFKGASVNLDKGAVSFNDFSIASEIDLTGKVFNAEKITVYLDKAKFDRERKISVSEVYVRRGVLNIERKRSGEIVAVSTGKSGAGLSAPIAVAENAPGITSQGALEVPASPMYAFAKSVRKVTIVDSVINFKDYAISGSNNPFTVYCDRLQIDIVSRQEPGPAGGIPIEAAVKFRVPTLVTGDATLSMSAGMVVYPDRTDMEMRLKMSRVNLMLFLPYLNRSTPFLFYNGLFNSDTDFSMHDNMIDSLTTISFHKLRFAVKPGMGDAQFIAASANQFAKYLSTPSGDVVFDFTVQGPMGRPSLGLGPQVKAAIGKVVMEEVGKVVRQLQQVQK